MSVTEKAPRRPGQSLTRFESTLDAEGPPTLASVVAADLEHPEWFSPEYRAWLEHHRVAAG